MKFKTIASLMIAAGLALPLLSHAEKDGDSDRASVHTWVKDSMITTKIKTELAANKASTLAKVHVDTDANGFVMLTGRVHTQADADRAVAIAKTVEGVNGIDSRIQVVADK